MTLARSEIEAAWRGPAARRVMARATALTPSPAHAATDVGGSDEDKDENWDSLADSEVAIALLTVLGVIGVTAALALGLSCVVVLRALT